MLRAVVDDAHQAGAGGHRRVPTGVHHPRQLVCGHAGDVLEGEFVHRVVIAGQQVGGCPARGLRRHRLDEGRRQGDLAAGVRDLEFVAALNRYLTALQADGRIEHWRLLRSKLGLGAPREFKVLIETRDLAQLDDAFAVVSTRADPVEEFHEGVCCFAAPLARGTAPYALAMSAPKPRFEENRAEYLDALFRTAAEASSTI